MQVLVVERLKSRQERYGSQQAMSSKWKRCVFTWTAVVLETWKWLLAKLSDL